jgi:hypothetical protein
MSENDEETVLQPVTAVSFAEFLEGTPPGSVTLVTGLARERKGASGHVMGYPLATPDIQLHCGGTACNRTLFFRRFGPQLPELEAGKWQFFYVTYRCSNCQESVKTFSLAIELTEGSCDGRAYKFGEMPEYGPPTSSRLIKLIGPDRDLFLKGRRCENQGLGIGAFGYYRRVVEHQKNRILDEIIKVAKNLNASTNAIAALEGAKEETQFSKALTSVKDAIPQSLLINGHNPLTLLHSALSEGMHERSDEECLELASSIRVVLAELSERLAQSLKDEAELNRALGRLMVKKKPVT